MYDVELLLLCCVLASSQSDTRVERHVQSAKYVSEDDNSAPDGGRQLPLQAALWHRRYKSYATPEMSAPLTGPLMCALRARHRLLGTTRLRPPITTTRCQTARFSTAANDTPHLSPSPSSLPSQPPPTPLPATTLAATYSQTGDPSTVLTTTRLPLPTALPPGSLLLRFLAAPINPSDLNMVEGSYPLRPPSLPATAGNEGVAVIAALGAEAARRGWRAGQWVTPLRPCMGTWRQYAVVDSATVEAVPPGLTVHQAAQLSVNPCTAYRLLTDVVVRCSGAGWWCRTRRRRRWG